MRAEIIAIGSELLLGQIVDTNSAHIARVLAENGIELVQTSTVGDDLGRMEEVIRDAIGRSEIVITTGGIGPTEDDLTRQAIANVSGRPLTFQPRLMELIEAMFKQRGFRMSENNRIQAFIPEGAIPIENPKGTAPGFIVEGPSWVTLTLPGVPSEMEYLLAHAVIPYLREKFGLENQIIRYKVLRACGLGESAIGLQIQDLMKNSKNPTVGTLAAVGDVRIRIAAKANDPSEASRLIDEMEREIRSRIEGLIYGVDDETLHGNIARDLEKRGLTLSVVETLTGGIITQKLSQTRSPAFSEGACLCSEPSVRRFLGVTENEFASLSNEPKKLADVLARKATELFSTDLGLAAIGRLVDESKKGETRFETFYSLCTPSGFETHEYPLGGEFWMTRDRAAILALDTVRKYLLRLDSENRRWEVEKLRR
jgi:nicotinamide-nucleotide amidase